MPLPPIIHEDDALLAFDKPSGLAVSPDSRERARENLKEMVQAARGAGLATVHRLDDETSGVQLYTKTKPALDFVSGQFQAKTAVKVYHALVVGRPEQDAFTVDLVLKEDEAAHGRMCVVKKHGHASWRLPVLGQVKVGAADRLEPGGFRCLVELHQREQIAGVGYCDRRQAEVDAALHELRDAQRRVGQRVFAVQVQMDESWGHADGLELAPSLGRRCRSNKA